MQLSIVPRAGLALVLVGISGCTSISVTASKPGEVLVCDGTWQQDTMFGHGSAKQSILVYPNPDATKIRVKRAGRVEGVCISHEGATCKASLKGNMLVVTSTFPNWLGTQTFTFDAHTAHMTFGDGGLDGGEVFSGTCRRKDD
ncbi:hypothetical protein [Rhodanobacter sp. DHG33]|uniref:hypothetical protein n=1 Tax=Rhodanobacter sp. DHG33 TaxID=2775921 RepID=UPI0017827E6D|nr:hypothetical protein [Rhodanobacter sp. DHG33]MBD8900586.1 hypothetical protein [Rhodanobacter sp. DHG33]